MKKEKHDDEDQKTFEENFQSMTIQREETLQKTFRHITEQVQKYIITKFLISLSVGLVMGFTLWLFDVDFFIIWASFAVILNFIPNIGSVISVVLPTLITLVQYESFGYAFLVAAILIITQNIIGNIIEPKIFGDRLGLNPLVILLSLLLWGYLWGIVGMFLAVPLTAVIKIIISNSRSKNMRFITNLMSN
jgi:predicted PurR-regulated permease PerM